MLTKSDRKTMAAMEAEFARDGHARSFIPAALADMDAKDALLARVLEFEWAVRGTWVSCSACGNELDNGHKPDCVFAAIAEHLEGVQGGNEDG